MKAQKSGTGGDTQTAEDLLLINKPLTDLISLLIPLVRALLFSVRMIGMNYSLFRSSPPPCERFRSGYRMIKK